MIKNYSEIVQQIVKNVSSVKKLSKNKILYILINHLFLGKEFLEFQETINNYHEVNKGIDLIIKNDEDNEWYFFVFYTKETFDDNYVINKVKEMYDEFLKLINLSYDELLNSVDISITKKIFFEKFKDDNLYKNVKFILATDFSLRDQAIKKIKLKVYEFIDNMYDFDVLDTNSLIVKYNSFHQKNSFDNNLKFNFDYFNHHNYDENYEYLNITYYKTNDDEGVILSLKAHSLCEAYNKFKNEIFEHNIRYGISGKEVDDGIKKTVTEEPENFWFYNNGITITCEKWEINSFENKIILNKFSIVNGAQTITNLAKLSSKNNINDVYIPTKIIAPINKKNDLQKLTNTITKTANYQKPVKARDFKSNSLEMKRLKEYFKLKFTILSIKRGDANYKDREDKEWILQNNSNLNFPNIIGNDELGQIILTLIFLDPCKALQNKNKIFSDEKIYDQLFKNSELTNEYIFDSYMFHKTISDKIATADSEIDFTSYNADDPEFKSNILVLKENIKKWLITLFWIINWHGKKINNVVNSPSKENIIPNEKMISKELMINFSSKTSMESFIELVLRAYKIIDEVYTSELKSVVENKELKSSSLSYSAFSFRKKAFEKFILSFFREDIKSKKQNLIDIINNLFIV